MRKRFGINPLWIVLFTVFVDVLGLGILIPIIPQLLANIHSPFYLLPSGYSVSQGYILLGFLIAAYPLGQFFATPVLGQLSDRYGRRPVLAVSLFGTSLSYAIFAWAILTRNIPLLFVARAFDGVTGGNISVAQAAIADLTTPQNRAKNFGLMGGIFGIGFILGPFIGGHLSDPSLLSWFNAATPFWFAAVLSFFNMLSVVFLFPETIQHRAADLKLTWDKSIRNIAKAFSMPKVRPLFYTGFLYFAGFTFFTTFFNVFLTDKFGFDQADIGLFFGYVGIWIAFTQIFITRRMTRFAEHKIVRFTIFGVAITTLLYLAPNQPWQFLLLVPFFAIFNGLNMANTTALLSRSVEPHQQGEILGINASVQALAQSIPPILSGYIASILSPTAPIFIASIVMGVAGVVFWLTYKPTKVSTGLLSEEAQNATLYSEESQESVMY